MQTTTLFRVAELRPNDCKRNLQNKNRSATDLFDSKYTFSHPVCSSLWLYRGGLLHLIPRMLNNKQAEEEMRCYDLVELPHKDLTSTGGVAE